MDTGQGMLEAEMNMFEQQISDGVGAGPVDSDLPPVPRAPIIAANTFTSVQDKLTKIASEGYGAGPVTAAPSRPVNMFLPHQLSKPAGQLPPPPPPPPLPELPDIPPAIGNLAPPPPPPPPPPPGYIPPPFGGGPGMGPRMGGPGMGPRMGPPSGFVPPPPGYIRGPGPPPGWRGPAPVRPMQSAPTVISSAPKVYASKPQLKRPAPAAEEEKPPAAAAISSTEQPPAFSAIPDKKSKAAAMAEKVASSATTVVEGASTEGGSGSSGGKGGCKVDGGPGGSGQKPQGTNKQAGKEKPPKKPKKFIRTAGGQVWEDRSLHDWDKDDFRIFAGDLGNDVTEDVLTRYFSVYPSFVKAKVVRDKRSNKTKGYGFISFRESDDYVRAMKEMNGKYVGSRPIKLRKSQWRDRQIDVVRKKQKERAAFGLL